MPADIKARPSGNDDARAKKMQELFSRIEAGVSGVFTSDNYRSYLRTMAKFHRYSARNCLLIHFQRPEATMVAGFDAWKKKFHRHVLAGEKGITIIGYSLKSSTLKKPLRDEKGDPVIGDDGKPVIEYVKHSYPVYFPVYVYDVSQTEGEPLPQLVHDLEGDVASYQDFLASCRKLSPYPIEFENIASPNVRGYCSFEEQRIVVRSGLSQVQTAKTVLHEITHAILHNEGDAKTRAEKELEAESAAFVICSHYGIDTSEYTFPYLASWCRQERGEPLPQLVHDLEGDVASYQDFLASCRKLSPYPIEFENIASPNVRGYCSFEEQRIVVRSGLSQVQTAKTVLHEITHAILHNEGDAKTRAEKELEAESAAFVICSHYGIDTSEYTFPYLASWCRQERDKLERCLDAIQKHAFSVIEQLDASMLELERAKADRGSLQQRLELAQAQSAIDLTRNPPSQVRNMELER